MSNSKNDNSIFGLVGEKLGHSFSPLLHARFADYDYSLIEIPRDEIDAYFERAQFSGVNVTIPYKETALRFCEPDKNARAIGCVNTLVNRGGSVKGYNTDTYGFEYMATRAGISFDGKRVTILGSGGTCRTAAYTASRLGAAKITIVSRHPSDLGVSVSCPVSIVSYDEKYDDCDILINTTPVGMYPGIDGCPVDPAALVDDNNYYVNLSAVIDVIYNPLRTRLILAAKKRGLAATGGLPMLIAQGYFASKLFTGGEIGDDPVGSLTGSEIEKLEEVTDSIARGASNIVLTGMPGSGKSTVAKIIAEKLGMEYADTDEIFTTANNISPGEYIKQYGEPAFRKLEKEAVREAAEKGGKVIATGGGVVLDPGNMELLRLNGTVVYIHRKLKELATAGRPLSDGAENLKALYYKRLPIYMQNCDIITEVRDGAERVADSITDSLHNYNVLEGCPGKDAKAKPMKILVINGPNLNMLGIREPDIYGRETYDDLLKMCRAKADELGVEVEFYQSNHEGDLVDIIQQSYGTTDGIVINPGAYTHTSVALLDALKAVGIPAIEVHISNVDDREEFRRTSYIRSYVSETILGKGFSGYTEAMEKLAKKGGG